MIEGNKSPLNRIVSSDIVIFMAVTALAGQRQIVLVVSSALKERNNVLDRESIVRTLFWTSAETLDFSLAKLPWKRPETRIPPLAIKNCPECWRMDQGRSGLDSDSTRSSRLRVERRSFAERRRCD